MLNFVLPARSMSNVNHVLGQLGARGMTRLGEHGDIDLAVSRAILEAAL